MNVADRPTTLDDTIEEINPVLYPNMYTAVVILLVMSALTHYDKAKTLLAECIVHQFSRVALAFRPNEGEGSN